MTLTSPSATVFASKVICSCLSRCLPWAPMISTASRTTKSHICLQRWATRWGRDFSYEWGWVKTNIGEDMLYPPVARCPPLSRLISALPRFLKVQVTTSRRSGLISHKRLYFTYGWVENPFHFTVQSQSRKHIFRADIFSLRKSKALRQTLPMGINEGEWLFILPLDILWGIIPKSFSTLTNSWWVEELNALHEHTRPDLGSGLKLTRKWCCFPVLWKKMPDRIALTSVHSHQMLLDDTKDIEVSRHKHFHLSLGFLTHLCHGNILSYFRSNAHRSRNT